MRDTSMPTDGRLYRYRNVHSVTQLPEWGTLPEWKRERRKIREHLWLCTGLNDRTAGFRPKGRVIRKFDHEGIVVENIQIETLPGLFVMGNLYRPKEKGRYPLILHPHGHAMHARTTPLELYSLPHRAMNSALLGFAGFAWSMIAYEKDAMQIPHRDFLSGPDKEICNLLGLSTFGLQVHNGMKILDYLTRRKDIDTRRIGCTGESGGATQTYFLTALDDRIKVAAPAVMLSGHFQGGCVCENAPRLHLDYSTMHYAALIAPRPMFLTGCSGDWTHHMRERELVSMRELYALYGKSDAIDGFYQDEAHNYDRVSREHVYAWMKRWLVDPSFKERRITESTRPVPSQEDLLVHPTSTPPVKGAIRGRKAMIQVWSDLHDRAESSDRMRSLLKLDLPARSDLLVKNRTPKKRSKGRVLAQNRIDYGRFSDESHLTCRFVLPEKGKTTHLILRPWHSEEAWQRFVSNPPRELESAISSGQGLIIPLLFGQRSNKEVKDYRRAVESSYLYTSYNRTMHEEQAQDIATTVRLAQVELGIKPVDIHLVAEGGISVVSLVAWAALAAQKAVGSYSGDLSGIDLDQPKAWRRYCYVPLILRGPGLQSLSKLCERKRATVFGVPHRRAEAFPAGFTVRQKAADLAALMTS